MNALVILALVACASAAPGGLVSPFPASTAPLGTALVHAAPVVAAAPVVRASPVVHAAVAPAVAHVSVPIQKTVHFETKPVVTGFSTSIIKPAIPDIAHPVFAPQQVQTFVNAPVHVAAPAPIVADAEIVEARIAAPVQAAVVHAAPAQVFHQAAPVVHAAPVAVRPALAADFEPLVTKQQVLAPVRTHTHITPQVTQVVPEVTVRKVVHDVPVQQVVGVHTPVVHQWAQPAVHTTNVVGSPVFNNAGQWFL